MDFKRTGSIQKMRLHTSFLLAGFLMAVSLSASTVTSNDFQLLGPDGKIAARLTMSGEGTPSLFFFDRQGRNRMNLSLYPEGVGGLVMNDPNGRAVAILRMHGTRERPVLVFKDQGQDRLVTGLRDDDSGEPYMEPGPKGGAGSSQSGFPQPIQMIITVLISGLTGFISGKLASGSK